MSPLNIAANTPASPAYSPLWAVELAKWVGEPGDRQTSVADVEALSAQGRVASFNPADAASNAPLARSGIVVNCPIVATVVVGAPAKSAASRMAPTGCPPSPLGYMCMVQAADGVAIHYTIGGARPPANACTQSSGSVSSGSPVPSSSSQSELIHFAVEGTTPGYAAMSFPEQLGKMWPANAIIGFANPSTGAPDVRSYRLTRYSVSDADATNGWASNLGYTSTGDTKVVCFSRAINGQGRRRSLLQAVDVAPIDLAARECMFSLAPQRHGMMRHLTVHHTCCAICRHVCILQSHHDVMLVRQVYMCVFVYILELLLSPLPVCPL